MNNNYFLTLKWDSLLKTRASHDIFRQRLSSDDDGCTAVPIKLGFAVFVVTAGVSAIATTSTAGVSAVIATVSAVTAVVSDVLVPVLYNLFLRQ